MAGQARAKGLLTLARSSFGSFGVAMATGDIGVTKERTRFSFAPLLYR